MKNNMYAKEGLDVVLLKPSKYGGDEPTLVIEKQTQIDNMGEKDTISIGLVEQNVLIPAINNNVKVKAFASMFQKSPLSLLALPGTKLSTLGDLKALEIGMHIDSTELMKTIVFHSKDYASTVRTVERSEKMEMLLSGAVNAIQVRILFI
jgi:ABC-type nitrate/sulfonate/bicarbonate transport system substrate-binding protein